MSDESSHPDPADNPAATIWERYRNDRNFFARPLFAMSFFASFLPYEWWQSALSLVEVIDHSPQVFVISLLGFLSALTFGLCRGYFGIRKPALGFALVLLILWLGLVGFIVLLFWDEIEFTREAAVIIGLMALFVVFPGIAILYVTYLLWRTNAEL